MSQSAKHSIWDDWGLWSDGLLNHSHHTTSVCDDKGNILTPEDGADYIEAIYKKYDEAVPRLIGGVPREKHFALDTLERTIRRLAKEPSSELLASALISIDSLRMDFKIQALKGQLDKKDHEQ